MKLPIIRLQPGRHKRVAAGHPWVYSNEIVMDATVKALPPGGLAQFQGADSHYLGTGCFHPHNLICGRIFTRDKSVPDGAWLMSQLRQALALREKLFNAPYYRLVHAEADGLPGLVIDRYGPHVIAQINIAGMAMLQDAITAALDRLLQPETIILRNDSAMRAQEGLAQEIVIAKGSMPGRITLHENGLAFVADLTHGQKTGWFYDQRRNRALVAQFCRDADMLDVYCHTGGFALNAAAAGARRVTGIDASALALGCAMEAAQLNKLQDKTEWLEGEAFAQLVALAAAGRQFDVVVADPPAFIKSRKDLAAGTRGYRKLARLVAALVKPGGFLFMASCSHHLTLDSLAEQIAAGLHDAGRAGQVLHTVFAAPDHPLHPQLPESAYLKGQLLRVTA